MNFRRVVQGFCLVLFLALLAGAGHLAASDLFLRLDPSLVGVTALSARVLKWIFIPALIVLVSAVFLGRAFCGYICPMGTTIDLSDRCLKKRGTKAQNGPEWLSPHLNLYLLIFLAGAGLFGVSLIFWLTPLGLITRLYGLLVYPVIELTADFGLAAIYPIADRLDIRSLMFAEIEPSRFAAQFFVLVIFILIFAAGKITPRFWCRYLCPAGGMLALAAKRPLIRRQVSDACNQCGICARNCPMGAIGIDDPSKTDHSACITCQKCSKLCPQDAIEFSLSAPLNTHAAANSPISPSRRQFLLAGAAGMGTAAISLTGLTAATDKYTEGEVRAARLIRPPGALPEASFLSACVRCGECMTACPTNTLQPIWFDAGFIGMFSPAIIPRRKYCDPRCTVCGEVCPTGAIRALSSGERVWAKTGTAVIYRQKCLAWEHKKSCMVCDEVCPYDAVEFEKKPELPYPVPHVKEDRCAGCGYCEHYCPVQNDAAIVVTPMDELRLKTGSYRETGKIRGYKMNLRPASDPLLPKTYPQGENAATPDADSDGPAPGFEPL
ncbi:MAG: 4Fe-4S binding protein [Desulfobacterales bacterium]|nr:4Fe-4S binding protein [Desulfobacterales bacterium]